MKLALIILSLFCPPILKAQDIIRHCNSADLLENYKNENPQLRQQLKDLELELSYNHASITGLTTRNSDITIPVVVHIVYNSEIENVSEDQVYSQINALNKDFNKENTEIAQIPNIFKSLVADCNIRFQLASQDPQGQATNGIVRHYSTVKTWSVNDDIKIPSKGGFEPWAPTQYLNIYVCNLGTKSLGFSSFPGMPDYMDGVVIDYKAFGTTGTARLPFNIGRTCVHEVGHWLGLFHIWGDNDCGNDYVDDTPKQKSRHAGCPTFPQFSNCLGTQSADLFMNFMDYVNDACMYMFTEGQKSRMLATIEKKRSGLLTSKGVISPLSDACIVKNIYFTKINTNSATINWTAIKSVKNYTFQYKTTDETIWNTIKTSNNQLILNNLKAGYTYQIRIQTDCDKAPFSNIEHFTTSTVEYRLATEKETYMVYPNPILDKAVLEIQPFAEQNYRVIISDLIGKIMFDKNYNTPSVQLDFAGMPQGVYVITVVKNETRAVIKVMKVRE